MKWVERVAGRGELPEDVLLGWPKVTLYGWKRLIVEQHRGIVTYQENIVRFKTACGVLIIEGSGLQIAHYGPLDAVVIGVIAQVGYDLHGKEGK